MEAKIKESICALATRIPLFQSMEMEEIEIICPYFEFLAYQGGTYIFREGDEGDWMGFIVSGKVEVQRSTPYRGKHIIMAYMSRGSVIGEMSLVEERERSASVYAVENTEMLILRRDQLEEIIRNHPTIGVKLLMGIAWILCKRLRQLGDRLKVII